MYPKLRTGFTIVKPARMIVFESTILKYDVCQYIHVSWPALLIVYKHRSSKYENNLTGAATVGTFRATFSLNVERAFYTNTWWLQMRKLNINQRDSVSLRSDVFSPVGNTKVGNTVSSRSPWQREKNARAARVVLLLAIEMVLLLYFFRFHSG